MKKDLDGLLEYVGDQLALARFKSKSEWMDIAKGSNVSRNSFYSYEKGRTKMSLEVAVALCNYFKITIQDLVGPYNYNPSKEENNEQ